MNFILFSLNVENATTARITARRNTASCDQHIDFTVENEYVGDLAQLPEKNFKNSPNEMVNCAKKLPKNGTNVNNPKSATNCDNLLATTYGQNDKLVENNASSAGSPPNQTIDSTPLFMNAIEVGTNARSVKPKRKPRTVTGVIKKPRKPKVNEFAEFGRSVKIDHKNM